MALGKQVIDIPLAAGLDTKTDSKAMQPPGLAVCRNAQFDEIGGIQTRKPYAPITSHPSNTIANIRKLAVYGDELVAFTKGALWSYASGDGLWTQRAEYLAVKVDETPRFVTTGEQFDCDRGQLGGVTMYCWSETTPTGTLSYVAAIDTATGAVKMSPTSLGAVVRPRISVTTNCICLSYVAASTLLTTRAYDPSDLTYSASSDLTITAGSMYDIMTDPADPATLIGVVTEATQYQIFGVDETGASTSLLTRVTTADGACAIVVTATLIAVVYSASTAVKTDLRNTALTTVALDIATGTASSATVNQITAAHDGTLFRAFWSAGEATTSATAFSMEANTITDAGVAGTESLVVRRCGLASRAFVQDGSVFVWAAFGGASNGAIIAQLQNAYFLYRFDGLVVAKVVSTQGGGLSSTEGHIPSVQSLGSNQWAWCGILRRIIPLGQDQKGYSAKSPQDVTFEFDSNEARRTVQLGETLYIAGGQLSQYDGRSVVEVGFHTFPWFLGISAGAAGLLNGTYNYQESYSWHNARGEFERSTSATISFGIPATQKVGALGAPLHVTAKTGTNGEAAVEFWRQIVAAPYAAPFYLVTSKDPASTGDNAYIQNDPTAASISALTDNLTDTLLISREEYPENGGLTLENLSAPACSIIVATQDRIIIAGIPGNPYRLQYSKLRGQGEVAAFHDSLYVDLPTDGGVITAVGFLGQTMVVFMESAVYMLSGEGYDNNGGGQNYGPAQVINSNVGAISAESVALTPRGLIFKSLKGWQLLDHGWQVQYIGGPVSDFDGDTVLSVDVMKEQHQVRCLTDARCLVWDYHPDVNEWSEWTISDGLDAVMFGSTYHYAQSSSIGTYVNSQIMAEQDAWDRPNPDLKYTGSEVAAGNSNIEIVDSNDWPLSGAVLFSRDLAGEEVKNYTKAAGTDVVTLTVALTNTQLAGATAERVGGFTQVNGASSPGSSLTVDSTSVFPATGTIQISRGLAAEEFVTYTSKSSLIFYGTFVNSHANNAEVILVQPEAQGLDLETGWIKMAGLQGFQRIRRIMILGEYIAAHDLRMRVAYNYQEDSAGPTWVDDETWTVSPTTANGPLQVTHGPSRPKCQSIKIRITAQVIGATLSPVTEALKLTALSLVVGIKPTAYKGLPVAQRQ